MEVENANLGVNLLLDLITLLVDGGTRGWLVEMKLSSAPSPFMSKDDATCDLTVNFHDSDIHIYRIIKGGPNRPPHSALCTFYTTVR